MAGREAHQPLISFSHFLPVQQLLPEKRFLYFQCLVRLSSGNLFFAALVQHGTFKTGAGGSALPLPRAPNREHLQCYGQTPRAAPNPDDDPAPAQDCASCACANNLAGNETVPTSLAPCCCRPRPPAPSPWQRVFSACLLTSTALDTPTSAGTRKSTVTSSWPRDSCLLPAERRVDPPLKHWHHEAICLRPSQVFVTFSPRCATRRKGFVARGQSPSTLAATTLMDLLQRQSGFLWNFIDPVTLRERMPRLLGTRLGDPASTVSCLG